MYGVTHSLTHLFGPLCDRGDTGGAIRMQERLAEALGEHAPVRARSGVLYNLGDCTRAPTGPMKPSST